MLPLPTRRLACSTLTLAGLIVSLGNFAPAAAATSKSKAPRLDLKVNYVQAHDGPIDCQREPKLNAVVFGFLPTGAAATSKRLTQMETDYRPRSGATLTIGTQRFKLTYDKSRKSVQGRQVSWHFRSVPITEEAGERAKRATIRYKTKKGSQTLKTEVFAEGCV